MKLDGCEKTDCFPSMTLSFSREASGFSDLRFAP
jgi:hypothetical protein